MQGQSGGVGWGGKGGAGHLPGGGPGSRSQGLAAGTEAGQGWRDPSEA